MNARTKRDEMMCLYDKVKATPNHNDKLLLIKAVGFCWAVKEDAKPVVSALGITMFRDKMGINIAKFPETREDEFLSRLAHAGYKVEVIDL